MPSMEKDEEDAKEEAAEEEEDVEDVEEVEAVIVEKDEEDHAVGGEVAQRRNAADVEAEEEADADNPTALSGGRKKISGRFFPARGERTASGASEEGV